MDFTNGLHFNIGDTIGYKSANRHEYELWSQALNVCIYPKHRPHLKLTLNKCIKGCTKGISEGDTDCQHPTVFSQKYQG